MKILSMKRPRPSIEITIPAASSLKWIPDIGPNVKV
jgi:hypothetical protein